MSEVNTVKSANRNYSISEQGKCFNIVMYLHKDAKINVSRYLCADGL